ncbi:MAG: 4Fe-4S dicluster domain-containing protein [Eggerthellaceae bacterium]
MQAHSRGLVHADVYAYHVSLSCNHCERPECVHVCPTGAMHKNELDLVCVDAKKCIGCGYCTMACPYHAPSIDPFSRQSSKCDGCSDRVSEGKLPICVEACPLRALAFGRPDELRGLSEVFRRYHAYPIRLRLHFFVRLSGCARSPRGEGFQPVAGVGNNREV